MNRFFSHHAYVVSAAPEAVDTVLAHIAKTAGIHIAGNPDMWHVTYETLGIDESRLLVERASRKPIVGDRQYFVVGFHFATTEAQNALLKLLEDPTGESVFFIVTPSPEHLLPTLRSRLQPLFIESARGEVENEDKKADSMAKKFLQADVGERMAMMEKMIEGKEKVSTIAFLNALEAVLAPRVVKDGSARAAPEEIIRCRDYLHDRAPSVKMILEHLALVAPIAP